ncbi:MAG TPA: hypothetical protein VNW94_18095 [Streptosporangiaceae bacterium]|nr:hypothetical protein [Streptosporangiaceae bacterium]
MASATRHQEVAPPLVDQRPGAAWKQLRRRPDFIAAAATGMLAFALGYYLLLLQVTNMHTMIEKTSRHPAYPALLAVLIPISIVLFGLNFALGTVLWRLRTGRVNGSGPVIGAILGSFGAACPSCGAFLLSVIGVTAGLSVLPFAGLELWAVAAAVMGYTLVRSLRALDLATCPSPSDGRVCELPSRSAARLTAFSVAAVASAAFLVALAAQNEPHLR